MTNTLYVGIANSPETTLAAAITAYDVTITLTDASVLPSATNICTIGTGEDAETIKFTTKAGNVLSGVTRGLEGTAKSWGAGETVRRSFANYDWQAAIDNIGLKADAASPTITGTAAIPTINLTGGQIKFPATQAASSDANTFDDYEEGTWTPDLKFGANTAGTQSNSGYYLKAAGLMAIVGTVTLTSKGVNTGDATITGLPFSITGSGVGVSIRTDRITFVNVPQAHVTVALATTIQLSEAPDGGGAATNLTDADFVNNSSIRFSFIARVV